MGITGFSKESARVKIALLTTDNREPFKDYAAKRPHFGTAPEALLQGFALLPGVEIHVVSCARRRMDSPERLARNTFFHSLCVPKGGWMRTLYQGCIRASRCKLKEISPDIVHGQGTELDCAISSVFSGFPNVITIHGNMRLIAKVNRAKAFSFPWLAARLESFTVPRSRGVVCITRYTQEAVAGLARRTWLLPNAVDASFFEVQPRPAKPPLILCVGLICPRKNQNSFIRALDSLAGSQPFELLFLGNVSPGRAYDDEFLSLIRTREWCRHLGFAEREALKDHLSRAALLALPSLEDNCPMAVLEAAAAGVPVAAANVGGVPDLVEAGKTGYLFDPLKPEEICSALRRALASPAELEAFAKEARKRAQERFHPRVVAQRHVEIYREVLDGR